MRASLSRAAIVEAAGELITKESLDAVSLRRLAAHLDVTAPRALRPREGQAGPAAGGGRGGVHGADQPLRTGAHDGPRGTHASAEQGLHHPCPGQPGAVPGDVPFPPQLGNATTNTGLELAAATRAFELPAAAEAVEAGRLRPDADPFIVALTTWAAIHGTATVLQLGFGFSPELEERLIDSVIETFIRGFQYPRGAPPPVGPPPA